MNPTGNVVSRVSPVCSREEPNDCFTARRLLYWPESTSSRREYIRGHASIYDAHALLGLFLNETKTPQSDVNFLFHLLLHQFIFQFISLKMLKSFEFWYLSRIYDTQVCARIIVVLSFERFKFSYSSRIYVDTRRVCPFVVLSFKRFKFWYLGRINVNVYISNIILFLYPIIIYPIIVLSFKSYEFWYLDRTYVSRKYLSRILWFYVRRFIQFHILEFRTNLHENSQSTDTTFCSCKRANFNKISSGFHLYVGPFGK